MTRAVSGSELRSSAVALAAAFVTALLLSAITTDDPAATIRAFLVTPVANRYHFGNMISAATLLLLTAGGVVFAFSSGSFNLGGEGQTYLAGLVAALVLARVQAAPGIALLLGFGAAALAGGALAALSGTFRARFATDELITSFLLSAAAIPVVDYLIVGPMRDTAGSLLATVPIAEEYRLTSMLPPSNLSTALFVGVAAVAILGLVLRFTLFGYEMRIVGLNRRLANYGGLRVGFYTVVPMALSGVFHGIAGAALVAGVHHRAIAGFTGGLGWNGIAVALIARNRPRFLIPAALLFAYLNAGSSAAVLESQATWEFGAIVQAVVFLFVTAEFLRRRRR